MAIDTPQSVTVVDQEDIDREQATTIGDTLKEVPGVQVLGSLVRQQLSLPAEHYADGTDWMPLV